MRDHTCRNILSTELHRPRILGSELRLRDVVDVDAVAPAWRSSSPTSHLVKQLLSARRRLRLVLERDDAHHVAFGSGCLRRHEDRALHGWCWRGALLVGEEPVAPKRRSSSRRNSLVNFSRRKSAAPAFIQPAGVITQRRPPGASFSTASQRK